MSKKINIFWFRRDLRLDDNIGFYEALKSDYSVLPIFIFDSEILDKLPKEDARVTFIHDTLQDMRQTLRDEHNSSIALFHGAVAAVDVAADVRSRRWSGVWSKDGWCHCL